MELRLWDLHRSTKTMSVPMESSSPQDEAYRRLFDRVPVGLFHLDAEQRLLDANPACVRMLGYTDRRTLIGKPLEKLLAEGQETADLDRLLDGRESIGSSEAHLRRLDGSQLRGRIELRRIDNREGELLYLEGVLEQADDPPSSEQRLRALVENTEEMIAIVDAAGRILYQSPSYTRQLGREAGERLGRSCFEYVHPEDVDNVRSLFERLVRDSKDAMRVEYRFRIHDGSWRTFESVGTNLLHHPAVHGVVVSSRDITERIETEKRLRHGALHDRLTGLPNRALLMQRLQKLFRYSRRGLQGAIFLLDLDRFQRVNDSLGHALGDRLLKAVGRRLRRTLRPTDTVARLGGDEFALFLEDQVNAPQALRIADQVRAALSLPFQLDGQELFTDVSIGIAFCSRQQAETAEQLLRNADIALHRAKRDQAAGCAVYDVDMHGAMVAQLRLETDLRRALGASELEVFYQPIVHLGTGEVVGFEALSRWRKPSGELLLPRDFLPTAEETGLINPLGRCVLDEACRRLCRWRERFAPRGPWFVSVNLSNRQFAQPDLVEQIRSSLAASGLPAKRLMIEITEGLVMEDPDAIRDKLLEIRRLGVSLALDDFGTGYSSLSLLHRFPFDKIKIDRWFVSHVGSDPGSEELVEGVLALCRCRRLATVAEGIETDEQRSKLTDMRCDYGQGFLFSKAIDASALEAWMEQGQPRLPVRQPPAEASGRSGGIAPEPFPPT